MVCRVSIAQPTIFREYTSRTQQQHSFPSLVGCSVMSAPHNWLRAVAVNVRDSVSEHLMTDPPLADRSVTPRTESTIAHTQHSTRDLGAYALPGQGFNDREPSLGRILSSLISQHRRCELCRSEFFFQFTDPASRISELRGNRTVDTHNLACINLGFLPPPINRR